MLKVTKHTHREVPIWGLVPVKTLARAMQRLRSSLGTDCPEFSITMFMDVIRALKSSKRIHNIAVVTTDPRVVNIAENHDLLVVDEIEAMGLNPALELGLEAIRRRGGQRVAIIPTDVPLITGNEVDRLLRELETVLQDGNEGAVGICPAKNGDGTNLLCVDTGNLLPLRYGPDSYNRHVAIAAKNGLRSVTLHSDILCIDIDEQQDLELYIDYCMANSEFQQSESWQFLRQKGYICESGWRSTG